MGETLVAVLAADTIESPRCECVLSCCLCDIELTGTPANREFWRRHTHYLCPVWTLFRSWFLVCVWERESTWMRIGLVECSVCVGELGVALFGHGDWTESACSHSSQPVRSEIWRSDLNTHSAVTAKTLQTGTRWNLLEHIKYQTGIGTFSFL